MRVNASVRASLGGHSRAAKTAARPVTSGPTPRVAVAIYSATAVTRRAVTARAQPGNDVSLSSTGLLENAVRNMPEAELPDTLWGYIMTHGYDPAVCASVASVINEDISRFPPSALVSILSAFAFIGHSDRDLVVTVASHLGAPYQLGEVDTGTLAQLAWVTALLNSQGAVSYDKEEAMQNLVVAVLRQAQRKVADFDPDDLSRLYAALAELDTPPPQSLVEDTNARLLETLIPLAQLEPRSLAQILWSYAKLGLYDSAVFDAAQTELQRKVVQLDWQGLANAAWAYATVRERDSKHRAVTDKPLLAALAKLAVGKLDAAQHALRAQQQLQPTPTPGSSLATDSPAADSAASPTTQSTEPAQISHPQSDSAFADAATSLSSMGSGLLSAQSLPLSQAGRWPSVNDLVPQQSIPSTPPVMRSHLMTLLLSYANLSHHDAPLFTAAERWLSQQMDDSTAQDLVVAAYVYARVKHSAPELMLALAGAVPKVLDELDGDDLVYLASLGPATSTYSEALMKSVFEQALCMTQDSPGALGPSVLLDLARCCAAVLGRNEEYYSEVQSQLLKAVNAAQLHTDMDQMSTHCGATNPLGLQK